MADENNGLLSVAEEKYFESRGEIAPDTETPPPADTIEPVAPAEEAPQGDTVEPVEPAEAKTVPLAALHEEREKRKKAQEEARKREADFERLRGRLEVIEERARQVERPAEAPDPLKDLEELKSFKHQVERQRHEQAQLSDMISRYSTAAKEFEAETPDFKDAYQHVVKSRIEELQAMGYPPQQAVQIAHANEAEMVAMALNQGANPAERIYALAKVRGYTAKPAKQATPTPAEKLETVQKGQQAARSLSNAPGSASKPGSLEALLEMSDEEFDEATKGNKWPKLFGQRT